MSELKTTEPAKPSERVERIRDVLLPDGCFEEELADALRLSRRTVQRLNLPFIRVGVRRVYNLPGSREALRRRPPSEAA